MRIGPTGFFHLTYCSNIHPGESWAEVFSNLRKSLPALKADLAPNHSFGIGLRLSNLASQEMLQDKALAEFQSWMAQNQLYVFTLNGFPYGSFHRQVIKDQVYAPAWEQPARVLYTKRLADILAQLLPEGMDGGISTVPLSYKPWLEKESKQHILEQSTLHLAEVAHHLVALKEKTGKLLHLDIEPEPDCLLENTEEVIEFFQEWLLPLGGRHLAEAMSISPSQAEAHLRSHIQVCYDICHFAVEFELPDSVFSRLESAGISIGKIQISAALKVSLTQDADTRKALAERLSAFDEPTYLHQVVERYPDGSLKRYPDLNMALPSFQTSEAEEWRSHFHVPIFVKDYHPLQSTQQDIATTLKLVQASKTSRHLEIETYTWEVLPPELKMDILPSIQREYEWVLAHFAEST